MNIDTHFPHPVLGNSDDLSFNDFHLNMKNKALNNVFQFQGMYGFSPINDDYDEYIAENKIKFALQAFCPQTFYRQYFESNQKTVNFEINQDSIRGHIEFTGYMIVASEIKDFSPKTQNKDYFGTSSFSIQKGDILGVTNTLKQFIDPHFKNQDNTKLKPIINILSDKNSKKDYYKVDWSSNQIHVMVPEKHYDEWEKNRGKRDRYLYLNHAAMYLPVFTDAINKVEEGDESLSEKKWFTVIEQQLAEMDVRQDLDSVIKAQILMNGTLKKYINQLVEIDKVFND